MMGGSRGSTDHVGESVSPIERDGTDETPPRDDRTRSWPNSRDEAHERGEEANAPGSSSENDRATEDGAQVTVRRTHRWRGIVAVVLVAVAVGLLAKRPSVLLLAIVGVAFATYPWLADPKAPRLSVERSVEPEFPDHDDVVEVTTTIRNEGAGTLLDLRIVDGVPAMLSVVDGSPRLATTLRQGEETTLEYAVCAKRGTHRFRPVTVLERGASGAVEVESSVAHETEIECPTPVLDVPLRSNSRHRTGRLVTDDGGGGIEFHRIREYRRGDPSNRIDWRKLARSGDLASIEYREERLADVVLCIDTREAAYRASGSGEPHAVAYAHAAVEGIAAALFSADHRVGLTAVCPERSWLAPGAGRGHEDDFFRYLSTHPAFSIVPPDAATMEPTRDREKAPDTRATWVESVAGNGEEDASTLELDRQLASITARLGASAQVIFLTPLCDDAAMRVAQRFEDAGRPVTVVSVDVTTGATLGGRLARIDRENRIHALRSAGVPVVDWDPVEPLAAALAAIEGGYR